MPVHLSRSDFEKVVEEALQALPDEIASMLDNIAVFVEQWPSREQLRENGLSDRHELFGLYEGVPLTERDTHYGMVQPDRIFIFQGPIEAVCTGSDELLHEIQHTVVHELAHHFGISDERLD
jgi:predicted Zn-dependent protease with MMP-like domain